MPQVVDAHPETLGPGANKKLLALKGPIEAASRATGVPASLLAGLIWQESRAKVHESGGGLTQMGRREFPATVARHPDIVGPSANARANTLAGAYYLLQMRQTMQRRYARSDWPIVLRAYNSGAWGVDPENLAHLPAHTGDSGYVTKITGFWQVIATGQGTLPG